MQKIIDELTFRSYVYNRQRSPEISPERWAKIFGADAVAEMEKRMGSLGIAPSISPV